MNEALDQFKNLFQECNRTQARTIMSERVLRWSCTRFPAVEKALFYATYDDCVDVKPLATNATKENCSKLDFIQSRALVPRSPFHGTSKNLIISSCPGQLKLFSPNILSIWDLFSFGSILIPLELLSMLLALIQTKCRKTVASLQMSFQKSASITRAKCESGVFSHGSYTCSFCFSFDVIKPRTASLPLLYRSHESTSYVKMRSTTLIVT